MRVIAGKARRLVLKTIEGEATRPTTDRTKETLFNIINNKIIDCRFLDLYSGSGAIGIEALSRRARECCFVENSIKAIECINKNLQHTKLQDDAIVIKNSVLPALKKIDKEAKRFDIVFIDPPYNHLYEKDVLIFLSKSVLIDKSSIVIIEASRETDFSYVTGLGFQIIKEKNYKLNKHVLLKLGGD